MINLRRPSQAIVPDGSITKEKLASNAVDASKIEDGAINLASAKVTGSLPNNKLDVIADVSKIQDNLITLTKVNDDVKLTPFIAGEEEQSVTGDVSTPIIETGMSKVSGKFEPKKIRVIATLKTSEESGFLEIFADNEPTARLTLETTSQTYELKNGEFDVSDLSQGRHNFTAKLRGTLSSTVVMNDYIEIYTVK
jgi:hypothetical protein